MKSLWKRIKRLFCCEHVWLTHFRGQFTRGVECMKCGKLDLLVDFNDGSEPIGWWIE